MVDRPKPSPSGAKAKKQTPEAAENLTAILAQKVVGQPAATKVIVPYIQMFQAGLAPEGRPVAIFLLLGVLDKGVLRLGDNSTVNFEKSLVFLTSNLGAREMMKEISPDFGFQGGLSAGRPDLGHKLQSIALVAVRKKFSPEFVNRID